MTRCLEGRRTRAARGRRRLWRLYVMIALVGVATGAVMVLSLRLAQRTSTLYGPQADAVMEARYELSTAYLNFEELSGGVPSTTLDEVWEGIALAEKISLALLDGGDVGGDPVPPLEDRSTRVAVEAMIGQIRRFRTLTGERFSARNHHARAGKLHLEQHLLLGEFLGSAAEVEDRVRSLATAELKRLRTLQIGTAALATLLAFLVGWGFRKFDRETGAHLEGIDDAIRQVGESRDRLREQTARFKALLDALPAPIFYKDVEGHYTGCNGAFERFLGRSRDEIVGATVYDVAPSDLAPIYHEADQNLFRSGGSQVYEAKVQAADGETRSVVFHKAVFHGSDGSPAGMVGAMVDITEHRRAEIELTERARERDRLIRELRRKNADLEQFTYTVSHDLKTPLVTLKVFLGLLERDLAEGATERVRADIGRLDEAATWMQRLLDELLDLSRIGRVPHPPERVEAGALAREAWVVVRTRAEERGARLVLNPDLPDLVGDRKRLGSVFVNLFANAVRFMGDQTAPRVVVGSRREDGAVVITVSDNGIGIDPAYHERIFGLFNRLDPDTEGTGVGLAIVKRVVDVHGGEVWVESEGEGRGATFCFRLPTEPEPTVDPLPEG